MGPTGWPRRRVALVLAGAVLLLMGAAIWWVVSSTDAAPAAGDAARVRDAADVSTMLQSVPNDPAGSMAASVRPLVADPRAAIPAGTTIEPHPATWQPDGVGGGTMTATVTVPNEPPVLYLIVVVRQSDGWKVAATMRARPR